MTNRTRAGLYVMVAVLAALAAPAAAAAAGKSKVVVGVLGLKGDAVAPGVVSKADAAVLGKFKALGDFKVIKGTDIGAMMMLMGCAAPTPDCLTLIGSSMKVAKIVHGEIEPAGGSFKVTLGLFDMTTGASKSRSDTFAEADLVAKVAELAGSLVSKSTSGVLRVSASVPGAGVMIDGGAAGTSPVTLSIHAGKHSVLVSAPGHKPYTADVDVAVDATVEVAAVLEPIRADVVPPPPVVPTKKDDPPPIGDGRIGDGGVGTGTGTGVGAGTGSGGAGLGAGTAPPPGGGMSPLRVAGFGGMALGVAAGAVAVYFGVKWMGYRKDFDTMFSEPAFTRDDTDNHNIELHGVSFKGTGDLCSTGPEGASADRPGLEWLRAQSGLVEAGSIDFDEVARICKGAKMASLIGWITAGAAGVLFGAGVVLVVAGGGGGAAATATTVRVTPEIGPGLAGATMTVRF